MDLGLYRMLMWVAVAAAIAGTFWMHGYGTGKAQLYEYQAEQAKAAVAVIKKIEKVKETVRIVHTKREVEIQKVFVPIEKEVIRVPSRPACNVTAGWMHIHNAAASGSGRQEGAVDDAADTGIAEADAASTVSANYKAFHQVANDLTACRAFVSRLPGTVK